MEMLETVQLESWEGPFSEKLRNSAVSALESGKVLFFPGLPFHLRPEERRFLSPDCTDGRSKNISFDPRTGRTRGCRVQGLELLTLSGMLQRYAEQSRALIAHLLPGYAAALEQARTSFRPVEAEGRLSTPRKDDRRLHVDAFPSRPMQGKRILRVFSNVNPDGLARVWELGEPFEDFVERFLPQVKPPLPGAACVQSWLGITQGRRSRYDHVMLQLHDLAKLDDAYQADAPRARIEFPAGSTWIVYTDRALHAALSGQYAFEQTFHLAPEHMETPERSPLRILETRCGRRLA